jgi:DNA-directed RNA polymerase specialized sigma24 family protein
VIDFQVLYERHAAEVFRSSYSLSGDRSRAEDLTSETFVRVWTARERVDLTTVTGYLLTIARHLYLQGIRRERRQGALEHEPAAAASLTFGPKTLFWPRSLLERAARGTSPRRS